MTMETLENNTRPGRLTREDYLRAERFLPWNAGKLVFQMGVQPEWIEGGDRFWYRSETRGGRVFVLVDPAAGTQAPAFDHARLAASLSQGSGRPVDPGALPFESIELLDGGAALRSEIEGTPWRCDLATYECTSELKPSATEPQGTPSPDGRWTAFVENYNLQLRSLGSGEVVALTEDGEPDNDYGTPNPSALAAAGIPSSREPSDAAGIWSPDGRRLLSYRLDRRGMGEFSWVQSVPLDGSLRPKRYTRYYPLPGDEKVPEARLIIFDVEQRRAIPVQDEPQPILYYGTPLRPDSLWWSDDGRHVYNLTRGRGYQSYRLTEIDAETGASRTLVKEQSDVAIDPAIAHGRTPAIRVFDGGASVLWFSQRDGWGHLYLYDAASGELVRQVTSGPWAVVDVLHIDEAERTVFFTAVGREPGRDPYYPHLYRVSLDGGEPELLTPEDASHQVAFAPSGRYFVDSYSRVDQPPVSVLRAADGCLVRELEHADVQSLLETGWRPPERFTVKARDGVTDIYGVLYRPSWFDPASGQRLPILDDIYAGPQTNRAPTTFCGFSTSAPAASSGFWQAQAIAELGFAVVMIDGIGMPFRSKALHDRSFRQLGDGGMEDHVVGIRWLAERYPYLDASRVGIYGHSAGGYASAHAILAFPDFYKAAVSSAGNHDHRLDKASWVERYMGLPVGEHYTEQANAYLVGNLKGKLFLVHGEMDENVHPASTLQLVDALIKQNKNFDLLIMPNRPHALTADPYFIRRKWEHFARHLLGREPLDGYEIRGADAVS